MKEVEKIEEKRGKNVIRLSIYEKEDGTFTFSLQCAVSKIIRAAYPHQLPPYPTATAAKTAAVEKLTAWTSQSPAAKQALATFDINFCTTQLEFDF